MIGAIILFLLGAASIGLAFYLKGILFFGGVADTLLFWGPIVLGAVLVILGIDRLEREYGFLNALLDKRDAKAKKAAKANKPAPAAASPQNKKKAAKPPVKSPAWSFKTSGAAGHIGTVVFCFVAEAVVMAVACYVMVKLTAIGKMTSTLHWAAIAVAALSYLVVFLVAYELDLDSRVFAQIRPLHKTREEVQAALSKALADTGYAHYHRLVVSFSAPAFLLLAAVAAIVTPVGLNFLVATPLILLLLLTHTRDKTAGEITNDFITKNVGEGWQNHLCPNKKCRVILGKYHIADHTALTGEKQSLGSNTYDVTDTYSNGYDTLEVHRTEKRYYVRTDKTYHHWYSCPRCGTRWENSESYSDKDYL